MLGLAGTRREVLEAVRDAFNERHRAGDSVRIKGEQRRRVIGAGRAEIDRVEDRVMVSLEADGNKPDRLPVDRVWWNQ